MEHSNAPMNLDSYLQLEYLGDAPPLDEISPDDIPPQFREELIQRQDAAGPSSA
jgi:hypothetical protein